MKPAWAQGANYDRSKLTFWTASPGFVLGESLLGVGKLGGKGADVQLPADFTSVTITSPTTVEQGMFVHREVETCQLTATLPEMVDLKGEWVTIKYDTTTLYRGRVAKASWTEQVDVGRDYLPGNTDVKTYRVALLATNGEEVLATTPTPPRSFDNETLAQRITSWTGLPVTELTAAPDLPVRWENAGYDTVNVRRVAFTTDAVPSLLETLRSEIRLRNMTFLYQPRETQQFVLKPNNQWLAGSAINPLMFTDDPDHAVGLGGDAYLHDGGAVSFSSRTIDEDESLFVQSARIRWGQYDLESPPADGQPVETVYGPFSLVGVTPNEQVVDLGTLDVSSLSTNGYRLARAVNEVLPLRRRSEPFTTQVVTPLQSTMQMLGTVPGIALLQVDGAVEHVAVLSRVHQITPTKWTVTYGLGPHHLLTRASQYDAPGVVVNAMTGTAPTYTFHWTTPLAPYELPQNVAMYEIVFATTAATARLLTSDRTDISVPFQGYPAWMDPPGTARSFQVSGAASGTAYWVMYSSNPEAGSGNPSNIWREGQPSLLGVIP